MSEQDGAKATALQRPTNDNKEAWHAYWRTQGQGWRTEPEIDTERQKYLAERRSIVPNIEQGMYPFRDIKLSRADVEWLLATHNGGRGPLFFESSSHEPYIRGLDLRGANLQFTDLHRLPLSNLRGGLSADHWFTATEEQREIAAVHLEGAYLRGAFLDGASLRSAHLEGADLSVARLENVTLRGAHLEGTEILSSNSGQPDVPVSSSRKILPPVDLSHAFFNGLTSLNGTTLGNKKYGFVQLVDVQWNNVNLSQVNWASVDMLGDEQKAHQPTKATGEVKDKVTRLDEYQTAVRANRQLAVELQSQGLNEIAARFAYRAQMLQRIVLRRQRKFGQYLFSLFLDVLAGYGYRPGRSVIWYLITIFGFALAYTIFGHLPYVPDALVFSLTSFHGRGFFPGLGSETSLHNPLVMLAAIEAVVGLLIEISFIATFTQRFFGK